MTSKARILVSGIYQQASIVIHKTTYKLFIVFFSVVFFTDFRQFTDFHGHKTVKLVKMGRISKSL